MIPDDEHSAVRLLRPLAGEPARPAQLDLVRAMREGRQRRRARWWATGTAVAALTAASVTGGTVAVGALDVGQPQHVKPTAAASISPSGAAAAPDVEPVRCRIDRLPTDGVQKALVTGGDPSGRYLVGRTYPGNGDQRNRPIVVWKDDKLVATLRLPGGDGSLDDINGNGIGVGSSFKNEVSTPWLYSAGAVQELLGGTGTAVAINEAGVIAGSIGARPVRWASVKAQPVLLKLPAGATEGAAKDVDEDGTILGTVGTATTQTGYLWLPDGTGRKMPLPLVAGKPATSFWPVALRGGWVTGRATYETADSATFAPYRYRVDQDRYEALPAQARLPARIATNGWVAGISWNASNSLTARGYIQPTIFTDRGEVPLPLYGKAGDDYEITALSDDGGIVAGYSVGSADANVRNDPLVWHCG